MLPCTGSIPDYKEEEKMTILGLPLTSFFFQIVWRVSGLIIGLVIMLRNKYEGKDLEDEYDDIKESLSENENINIQNWYRTF